MMNKYNDYRQIDLPWLKDIPSHWGIRRNKNIFTEMKNEVGEDSDKYTLLSLSKKGIIPRDVESGKGKFPEKFDKYKIVKPGYMAFCLFDIDETPRTVGLSELDGMLTGAYTIMDVHDVNPRYAFYYYLALDNVKALKPLYSGLRKTINSNVFQSTKVPVPPMEEQNKIVAFLDWKTTEINWLIAKQRQKILRLRELEHKLIKNAITRGVNSEVQFRNSGNRFIGEVPEHWQILPLYAIASIRSDSNHTDLPLLSVYLDEGVVPFSSRDERRTNATSQDLSKYQKVEPGDFVVNNQQAWRGSVGVSNYEGIVSPSYIVLHLDDTLLREYANYLLRSTVMVDQYLINSKSVGSIQRNIYWPRMKRVDVPVPPKNEQQDILDYIDEIYKKIEALIHKYEDKNKVLEELKTKIISNVTTGKIDVREVYIPEYDASIDEDSGEDDSILDADETEEQED